LTHTHTHTVSIGPCVKVSQLKEERSTLTQPKKERGKLTQVTEERSRVTQLSPSLRRLSWVTLPVVPLFGDLAGSLCPSLHSAGSLCPHSPPYVAAQLSEGRNKGISPKARSLLTLQT